MPVDVESCGGGHRPPRRVRQGRLHVELLSGPARHDIGDADVAVRGADGQIARAPREEPQRFGGDSAVGDKRELGRPVGSVERCCERGGGLGVESALAGAKPVEAPRDLRWGGIGGDDGRRGAAVDDRNGRRHPEVVEKVAHDRPGIVESGGGAVGRSHRRARVDDDDEVLGRHLARVPRQSGEGQRHQRDHEQLQEQGNRPPQPLPRAGRGGGAIEVFPVEHGGHRHLAAL